MHPSLRDGGVKVEGGASMKPINAWPLIAMLIMVVAIYLWLNGYFA